MLVDINAEDTESSLFAFLEQYTAKNIMKEKNCFKNPYSSIHIDIFLNSSQHSFQNTMTISTGMTHFHKTVITIWKSLFIKLGKAKETYYWGNEQFTSNLFRVQYVVSLDCINKDYDSFEDTFMKTLNKHEKGNLSGLMRYPIWLRY